jgi:hypothetical protein
MATLLIYYYPHFMAVVFLTFLFVIEVPAKGRFFLRSLVALVIATFLAHVNRIFHLDPAHLYFPSGHMTFCLGISISLALLRPWTIAITIPSLILLGVALVVYHFHTFGDVLGAVPLVFFVYVIVHVLWPLTPSMGRATL